MSLDLINVGAEANDGTGDTPRAAFTKVNAAIAALNDLPASTDYSADIAALQAVQGSQAAAILALESDVADQGAAIAAIDGFSGDYNDLTNRPSLFSGAYDDLSSRPTIPFGFTYDQTTEPTSPTVNQTWRDSEGEVWRWDGTYWERPFTECLPIAYWTIASASISNLVSPIAFSAKVLGYTLITATANSPQDSTNYWDFRGITSATRFLDTRNYPVLLTNNGSIITEILPTPEILLASDTSNVYTIASINRVGSPGSLRRGQFTVLFRRVKA